jgi:hypothetical protein
MSTPHLTVVGPYIRHTPRSSLDEKAAFLGAFGVLGLLVVEWHRRRTTTPPLKETT